MNKTQKYSDEYWIQQAIKEAQKALGATSPNPMVGAIIVKKHQVLSKGYHRKAGQAHAEVDAIQRLPGGRPQAKGSTLYVTLEPCCHQGKRTPPCVDTLIQTKFKRVVIGCRDPNPQVAGRGIQKLKAAGIEIKVGVLQAECEWLNRYYNRWIQTQQPYVLLKMATSLDGRVALSNGKSKWITNQHSRNRVHQLRSEVDAILAGVGTILRDNPRLTARTDQKNVSQPIRIILDPLLQIPIRSRVLNHLTKEDCFIFTRKESLSKQQAHQLAQKGAKIFDCPVNSEGNFRLRSLLKKIGKKEITSLLIEGGPFTWTHFLQQNLWNECWHFMAPIFLGNDAQSMTGAMGLKSLPKKDHVKMFGLENYSQNILLKFKNLN